jgi:hypothetical protein
MADTSRPLVIPVILGTARQGRQSEHAAKFVFEQTKKRPNLDTELIDIRNLPNAARRRRRRDERPRNASMSWGTSMLWSKFADWLQMIRFHSFSC